MKDAFKTHFWISVILWVSTFTTQSFACDICGCAASGAAYFGILPQFQRNFAGLRFQYRSFSHPQTEFNVNGTSKVLEDRFFSQEIWFRYYPHKKIQILGQIPLREHIRYESKRTTRLSGLGDIHFSANVTVLNTGDSLQKRWKQTLLAGIGIKANTGKYQQRDETQVILPAAFQLGTGGWAYQLQSIYTLRHRSWGINADIQYRKNTNNEAEYQFGDQFTSSFSVFYWKNTKHFQFLPYTGLGLEFAAKDKEFNKIKPETGGKLLLWNAGLDTYYKKWILQLFVQQPVFQQLPKNQPAGNLRLGSGIAMLF